MHETHARDEAACREMEEACAVLGIPHQTAEERDAARDEDRRPTRMLAWASAALTVFWALVIWGLVR